MDPIDLDEGERLSSRASSGRFAMSAIPVGEDAKPDPAYPAPNCWFGFGRDTLWTLSDGQDVRVYVNGDNYSLVTSEGAIADGALVAWLLTNREELIRLARIGMAAEGRAT